MKELHGGKSSGYYLGMTKTRDKVRLRFYWVGTDADIRSSVQQLKVVHVDRLNPTKWHLFSPTDT